MDDDKFLLTIEILGNKYPLKIDRAEEQAFRSAAKQINNQVNRYRSVYGGEKSELNDRDFIVLTAVQALVENFFLMDKNDTQPYDDKIQSLLLELNDYLEAN